MTQSVEEMIKAKGLTAPRITPEHVDSVIVRQQFHLFPGTTTMVCLLELKNGFTVIGKSACASPENYDHEVGMRVASDDAKRQIWQLEGYLLKSVLHAGAELTANPNNPFVAPAADPST